MPPPLLSPFGLAAYASHGGRHSPLCHILNVPPFLPVLHLFCSVCLDCIVTVVDARHIRRQLADARPDGAVNEAQQQVAFADVVLLNKVMAWSGCTVCAWLAWGGGRWEWRHV